MISYLYFQRYDYEWKEVQLTIHQKIQLPETCHLLWLIFYGLGTVLHVKVLCWLNPKLRKVYKLSTIYTIKANDSRTHR